MRHGRSKLSTRLHCETLEPRETPATVTVVDYSAGFARGDEFRGRPPGPAAEDLVLTDGPFQSRAVWVPDRVHVGAFETSFVFRQTGEPGRLGDGLTFALIGDGDAIWQPGAAGAGLGYQGLADSVAVKFDLVNNAGEGGHSVGVFTGGAEPTVPAIRLDDTLIHLHAQHPIRADIAYNGSVLTLTLTDTVQPDHTWTHQFAVDIPAAVGGPTAYVGFTAGTGELFARQAIDSWTYAEVVPDTPTSQPPVFVAPPRVSWVAPGTVALSAHVSDDGGLAGLTYRWEIVYAPNGGAARLAPWPSEPGRPVALTSETMGYGLYTYRLTVRDAEGQTATREVWYDFGRIVKRVEVAPATVTVAAGGSTQFTVTEYDRAGIVIPFPLAPNWRVVNGPGTIDETGRYTAPADASGTATVEAFVPGTDDRGMNIAGVGGTATVVVAPQGPTITSLHAEYGPNYSVHLTSSAADTDTSGGLTYAWEVTSFPPSSNPGIYPSTPDPSTASAYPSARGVYTFRLTVRDANGQAATGDVNFNYDPRFITSMELTPQMATVPAGGSTQFTAIVRDQYGEPMPGAASLTVFQGPGTISRSGWYTAPPDVSGSVAIQAQTVVGPSRYQNFIFKYATVRIESTRPPEPPIDYGGGFAGADLRQNGSAQVVGDRLRLADGPFQAGSAFAPTPVELNRQFVSRFRFQVGDAPDGAYGDGLTFVLQGAGPEALGAAGGGLGYAGIPNSVAIKFDLVDNAGEGADTTGMYTNGAEPTVPAEGSIVPLHSGHVFQVDARYDGHNLTVVLEDTVTGGYHIGYYQVDLAAALGGSHAYVGFTAGTGELFAPIDILDWKYASTDNWDVGTIHL